MTSILKCVRCGDEHKDTLGDSICVDCHNPEEYTKLSNGRGHLAYSLTYCQKHGYDNIMDIALAVRMNSNGSMESPISVISRDVECLEYIVKTWRESIRREDSEFDNAVLEVCHAALNSINKSYLRKHIDEFRQHTCETAEYMRDNKCIHCGKFVEESVCN